MRRLRTLLLFMVTSLASLACASPALAFTEFILKSSKYPSDLKDKSLSVQRFSIGTGVSVECSSATSHGLAEKEKQKGVIDTVKFEVCKAMVSGIKTAVKVSEGEFELVASGQANNLREIAIEAEAKGTVLCEVRIPISSGLETVTYSNQKSGKEIVLTAAVTNLVDKNTCGAGGAVEFKGEAGLFGEEQCWTTHEAIHRWKNPACTEESPTKEGLYEIYPPVEFLEAH
jgi:hypothetical protein